MKVDQWSAVDSFPQVELTVETMNVAGAVIPIWRSLEIPRGQTSANCHRLLAMMDCNVQLNNNVDRNSTMMKAAGY